MADGPSATAEAQIRALRRENESLRAELARLAAEPGGHPAEGARAGAEIPVSPGLEQKQPAAGREGHVARLRRLFEVSRQVLAEPTLEGLLQRVVDVACELTDARVGIVGHAYQGGACRTAAFHGLDPRAFPPGGMFEMARGGVYEVPLESGGTLRLSREELLAHPRWWGLPARHGALNGLLAAPLVDPAGRPAGLIMVTDRREGEFSAEDEALLGQLAALLSAAMHHVEARHVAEEAAARAGQLLDQVRAGRSLWEQLMAVAPVGIAVLRGPDHRFEYVNPCFLRLSRISELPLAGRTVAEVFPGARETGTLAILDEVFATGRPARQTEFQTPTVPGGPAYWTYDAVPLHTPDGRVDGVLILEQDVTGQVQARQQAEALAAQAQERAAELDAVFTAIPQGAVVFEPDGRIRRSNRAGKALYHLTPEYEEKTLDERMATRTLTWPDGEPVKQDDMPLTRALRGETVRNAILAMRLAPDRPPVWMSVSAAPYRGPNGEIRGVVLAATDITELRVVQERLQEAAVALAVQSEELRVQNEKLQRLMAAAGAARDEADRHAAELDAAFAALPVGVVFYNSGGDIVRQNEVAARVSSRMGDDPPDPLAESGRRDLITHADGRPLDPEEIPVRRALRGETVRDQFTVLHLGEKQLRLLASAAPTRGPDGEILGAVGVLMNVTELHEVQRELEAANELLRLQAGELRQAEDRYRTFISHSTEAIWRVELEQPLAIDRPEAEQIQGLYEHGYVAECNEVMARMHGLEGAEEVIGRRLGQLLPRLSAVNVDLLTAFVRGGYSVASVESQELGAQGEVRSFLTSLVGIVDPATRSLVRLWGVKHDLTELRRVEDALREQAREKAAVEERQRLARDLHDAVSQTLFSASLTADVLPRLYDRDPVRGQELLAELRRMNRGALAEMRTLLLELRPQALLETDLAVLLRQLGEAAASRSQTEVAVSAEGTCALPPDVQVAFYRIAQEALHNVAKHAQAGHAAVRLRYTRAPDGQCRRLELSVADDGRGFDPSRARADQFGLSIMAERARAVGATFDIDSEPGGGTRVGAVWDRKP